MDMWNWLMECYKEGSLTLEDCERVMVDDKAAIDLWEDWSRDSSDFIAFVREEMHPFIKYKKRAAEQQ